MMKPHERRILVTTCFGHFMSHYNMLVFPAVVLPLTQRLHLPMSAVLELSFWMYLLFGLTALPWGIAADRWGAKKLLVLFYCGSGLAGLCASLLIDSTIAFSLSLAAIGFFSGIYHPAGLGLISKETQRVSYALGINGMFGNLGLATAPLLTGVITWLWGPQSAYLLLGGMNLFGAVIMGLYPLAESQRTRVRATETDNGKLAAFLILLVAMMLGGIVYRGATVILPAYFELKNQALFQWLAAADGEMISKNVVATVATSFIFLVGMLGQYIGGRVAEQYTPKYGYLFFHAVTIPMALLMAVTSDFLLVFWTVIYFFFLLGMQPIENTLVATYTPRRFHHSAFGTKFVLTFGVGALAVKMVALIEKGTGIDMVFPTLGLVSLLLVGMILVLIRNTSETRQLPSEMVQPQSGSA